jgi:hypothetical protein
LAKSWRIDSVFHSPLKHDLEAHANTEHRAPPCDTLIDDFCAADLVQSSHHGPESANTRDHQAVCLKGFVAVVGQSDICASMLESFER